MVLLTGATGYTGQRLLPRLRQRTESIRVLVRQTSDRSTVDLDGLDVVVGDLDDAAAVRAAVTGVRRVVQLAHIRYTPRLLDAAAAEVDHVVALSSLRLLSAVPSPSVDEVAAAEERIRQGDTPCTILRPAMIYGPHDRNLSNMVTHMKRFRWVPVFGNGQARSQPVYVEDVVAATLSCLEHPETAGRAYALAGPRPLTYQQIIRALARAAKVRPLEVRIPVTWALALLRLPGLIGLKAPITAEQVRRSQEDKVFSIEAARADLDFDPLEFDEALARIYAGPETQQ